MNFEVVSLVVDILLFILLFLNWRDSVALRGLFSLVGELALHQHKFLLKKYKEEFLPEEV